MTRVFAALLIFGLGDLFVGAMLSLTRGIPRVDPSDPKLTPLQVVSVGKQNASRKLAVPVVLFGTACIGIGGLGLLLVRLTR
jgi:hypothetical protein